MNAAVSGDGGWNVAVYEAFHDLRLRPALDLLARVPFCPPGDVIDLGCGAGAVGVALRARFPDRHLVGMDGSADMLRKAAFGSVYDQLDQGDIAAWRPETAPALIFSNAALHWLGGHEALIPRLFDALAAGGVLAVQMPSQLTRPSHQTMIAAAAKVRPDLFQGWRPFPSHLTPAAYADLLPDADVEIWTTEYHQLLPASADGAHPVRNFSSSTAGRPVLSKLDGVETKAFAAAWDKSLEAAYPRRSDGGVWFPFQRLFFVASKAAA